MVLSQGDTSQAFGIIIEGRMEVYHKTMDGEDTVYRVLVAPDTFGIHSLFENTPRPTGIRALGPARVLVLDRIGFLRKVHDHPQMAFQVLKAVSLRINRISEEIKHNISTRDG